jgi:hypothetical protein
MFNDVQYFCAPSCFKVGDAIDDAVYGLGRVRFEDDEFEKLAQGQKVFVRNSCVELVFYKIQLYVCIEKELAY